MKTILFSYLLSFAFHSIPFHAEQIMCKHNTISHQLTYQIQAVNNIGTRSIDSLNPSTDQPPNSTKSPPSPLPWHLMSLFTRRAPLVTPTTFHSVTFACPCTYCIRHAVCTLLGAVAHLPYLVYNACMQKGESFLPVLCRTRGLQSICSAV